MTSLNARTSSRIIEAALHALQQARSEWISQEAAAALSEVGELILTRATLLTRIKRAAEGTDVVSSRVLGDQLAQCVAETEQKLHEKTQQALQLMKRSA